MSVPISHIDGHLAWGLDGSVWAVWVASPASIDYRGPSAMLRLYQAVRTEILTIAGHAWLAGLLTPLDPARTTAAMRAGVDTSSSTAEEVIAYAGDRLTDAGLHDRHLMLGIRLPDGNAGEAWRTSLYATKSRVARSFGLPTPPPTRRQVTQARAEAARIGARIGRGHELREATAAEVEWVYARAPRRGVAPLPVPDRAVAQGSNAARLAAIGDYTMTEGRDPDTGRLLRVIGGRARFLCLDSATGRSWQAFGAVTGLPFESRAGMDWMTRIREADVPLDWCIRVETVPARMALPKLAKKRRALVGQFAEHDDSGEGLPDGLAAAVEQVDHQRERLRNPTEVDVRATFLVATWGRSRRECEARVNTLSDLLGGDGYGLPWPTGGQGQLYVDMLPGAPVSTTARHYQQYGLADLIAATLPWAGHQVGNPRGGLVAFTDAPGVSSPVLLDPGYGPRVERKSGAIAWVGDSGSGKSYSKKLVEWSHVAAGGGLVLLDRTHSGEYVDWAGALPVKAQIVRLGEDAPISIDPMKIFTGDDRITYTRGFCSVYAGLPARGGFAAALEAAVEAVAGRGPDGTTLDVVDELDQRGQAGDTNARQVAELLAPLRRSRGLTRMVTSGRPPLDLAAAAAARACVFHLPGLNLPTREQMRLAHLAAELLPEQVASRAIAYLAVAITKVIAYADKEQIVAVGLDELWDIGASMEGEHLQLELARDGRKHGAVLFASSQDVDDIPESVREHIPTRVVMRQDSEDAARRSLAFLGADVTTGNVEELQSLPNGVGLLRDLHGRIGRVAFIDAPLPGLERYFQTDPSDATTGARDATDQPAAPEPVQAPAIQSPEPFEAAPDDQLVQVGPADRPLARAGRAWPGDRPVLRPVEPLIEIPDPTPMRRNEVA